MDFSLIYSIGLGSAIVFLLTWQLCDSVFFHVLPIVKCLLNILTFPRPRGQLSWIQPKSWAHLVLFILYFGGTIASNTIHVSSISQASSRAAKICLVNLLPLLVCDLEFGAHLLGMSLDLYHSIHMVLGIMAFIQGLIHALIEVSLASGSINLHNSSTVYAITAMIIFISLMSTSIFKTRLYELFVQSHRICALGLIFATWRHISPVSKPSTWYIIGAAAVYAVTALMRLLRIAFRNFTSARQAECLINRQGNNLEIILYPARPWTVRAGERVNLSVPSAGLLSLFQMHPFVIAWWDNNEIGRLESITLLVRPRSGLTEKLSRLSDTRRMAWIDGPYGPDRTIGIGITAQIPYIKQLFDEYRQGLARTQRIRLIWQLDVAEDYQGARDWLQGLVSQDRGYQLQVHIFDPDKSHHQSPQTIGEHKLINISGGTVDWRDEILAELRRQIGTMLITVSATSPVRNVIRKIVQGHWKDKVELLELEFQPWEQKRSIWSYF